MEEQSFRPAAAIDIRMRNLGKMEKLRDVPTFGLITDVGNDLFYGAAVEQVLSWVVEVAERLIKKCQQVVLTLPPVENAKYVSEWRYSVIRSLF